MHDLGLENEFLDMITKGLIHIRNKVINWKHIKIYSFCSARDTVIKRTMYKVCFKTLALLWSKTHKFCLLFSFQNKWGIGVEEQQCTAKTTQGQRQRQKANENAGSLTLCANVSPGVSTTDHISLSGKVNKRLLSLIHKTAMETTDSSIQNHLVPNESHEWFTWFSTTNQLLCDQWFPSHWKENMKTHNCTEWAVFL